MKINDIIQEGLRDPKDNPCWKGYHPVGTKKKDGRTVPNCVPESKETDVEEASNPAQQAAIAIAKKKKKEVAEGVADTMTMQDAVKVLRHYGAGHFKTTSNELHFYKDGRPLSVDLVWGDDGNRSVNLSQLNSAIRQANGQGVAEGLSIARKMIAEGQIAGFRPPFTVSGNWVNDSRGRGVCEMGESRAALKDIADALNAWVKTDEARKPKPDMTRRNFLRGMGAAAGVAAAGYGVYKADEYAQEQEQKFLDQITDPADVEAYKKLKSQRDSYPQFDYQTSYVGGKQVSTPIMNPNWAGYASKLEKMRDGLKQKYEISEGREWDEGNTEPGNNFAVYIDGRKWKVFAGAGHADSPQERQRLKQLQAWAAKKSAATGKKWTVHVTGEVATA